MNELVKAVIGLCEKCGPSPLRGPKARAVVKSFLKKSGRSAEKEYSRTSSSRTRASTRPRVIPLPNRAPPRGRDVAFSYHL